MTEKDAKPKFALALSGGALRGAAHIGIIEVLLENGLIPSIIAGSSAGSLIGALFARGVSTVAMRRAATAFPGRRLIDWSFSTWSVFLFLLSLPLRYFGIRVRITNLLPIGFIRGNALENYIRQLLNLLPVRQAIPLLVVTTDMYSGDCVVFTDLTPLPKGYYHTSFLPLKNIPDTVRASCSIPGIFTPKKIDGHYYIDGSIRENVPADLLYRVGAQKVIAVDLQKSGMNNMEFRNFTDVLSRAINILLDDISSLRLEKYPAYVLAPELPNVTLTAFDDIELCIEGGRKAAQAALPQILKYLSG